jgi:hypothetical protein
VRFTSSFTRALLLPTLLAAVVVSGSGNLRADDDAADKTTPNLSTVQPAGTQQLQPAYEVIAGVDGEIFPAFASYASLQRASERRTATISVKISNPGSSPLRNRVSVQVPGWSDEELQTVDLAPGETRTVLFAPSFLPRFYANTEIAAATAVVKASDPAGALSFTTTVPVRLRSADDMYWGENFKYSRFIASWVTPHDPAVEELLGRAKELANGRRLPGYETWKSAQEQEKSTTEQARAIYQALQQKGLSYVKSSITFGERTDISERIRMPHESLRNISANCIDGVVMYASMFENLAMDPVVVLVPGHALVGVRLMPGSDKFLYIDTVMTGRGDFENAVSAAGSALARYTPDKVTRISITDARRSGVYPMPAGEAAAMPVMQATTQAH